MKERSEQRKREKGDTDKNGGLLSRVPLWETEKQSNWGFSEEMCKTHLKIVLSWERGMES